MLWAYFFDLKRFRTWYRVNGTRFDREEFMFGFDPTLEMSFQCKFFEVGSGASYESELKFKLNWLERMKRTVRQILDSPAKEWKSRKEEEELPDENHVPDQLPWASTLNDVHSCIKISDFSNAFRDFQWICHKKEVLCCVGCFSILVLVVLLIHFATEGLRLTFAMPWILTASLSVLLFARLFLYYEASQFFYSYVSYILFLLVFMSWFIDNSFCIIPASKSIDSITLRQDLQYIDISLLIGLTSLLSHTLFLPAKGLSILALPSLFILVLAAALSYVVHNIFAPQALYVLGITIFLSFATLFIGCLGSHTDKQLYDTIKSLQEALSERKVKEEEAIRASEWNKAEYSGKVNQMKQFISFILHEIRVPFNAVVLGIGHMLAGSLSDEQCEILKMMDASSSLMIHILNDVLDMGKIEAGKLQLEKQPFNMGELVSSLIRAFKDILDSKGIEFFLHIDEATKQFLSHHELIGDKHRVRQVLANYLSNAAKFTPPEGKIRLGVICNGMYTTDPTFLEELEPVPLNGVHNCKFCSWDWKQKESKKQSTFVSLTLYVEDSGIGISKEDQAKLFEPYSQIKAGSVQGGGGTGLGLCFSKRIVELSGGTVGVQSEVGKGSIFSFVMPFEISQSVIRCREREINAFDIQKVGGGLARTISMNNFTDSSLIGHKPKVLIVEDNHVNQKILKKLLSSFNIDSEDVEDGKAAVELCRGGRSYDMILIDKEMPIMDGLEATRQLRAMGINVPIVGLTGNALDSDRNQFLAAGVDDFFTKPISRHQLVRLLETHCLITRSKK